jgi:pantetheine-phosphate adenylyltransferase
MTTAVYPGTFDPIHNGHIDVVRRAVKIFDELIVAVYDRPLKTLLFDTDERLELLEKTFSDVPRVRIVSYNMLTVNLSFAWR